MAVDIKKVSRGIVEEVYGKGKLDYLDQVCDRSFEGHDPLMGDYDLGGMKRQVEMYRASFPDMKPTVVAMCAEGDTCCMHWRITGTHEKRFMGAEPTGKKITVEGISFDRYENGKLVESFTQWDTLGFLRGLGLLPEIEAPEIGKGAEQQPHA